MESSSSPQLIAARAFLALGRFAVVGLARDPRDFTRTVARELWTRGYDAVPVHPEASEIEGHPCFARIGDVTPTVEGALLFTPPIVTSVVVRDAIEIGVKRIWMHRGAGKGSASPEALAACAEAGVEVIDGLCPFMAFADAGLIHRAHRYFLLRALARRDRLTERRGPETRA